MSSETTLTAQGVINALDNGEPVVQEFKDTCGAIAWLSYLKNELEDPAIRTSLKKESGTITITIVREKG